MLETLEVALSSGLESVKLNVVVIKDLNDSEVPDFVEITRQQDVSVRFIEFMPFAGSSNSRAKATPLSKNTANRK